MCRVPVCVEFLSNNSEMAIKKPIVLAVHGEWDVSSHYYYSKTTATERGETPCLLLLLALPGQNAHHVRPILPLGPTHRHSLRCLLQASSPPPAWSGAARRPARRARGLGLDSSPEAQVERQPEACPPPGTTCTWNFSRHSRSTVAVLQTCGVLVHVSGAP